MSKVAAKISVTDGDGIVEDSFPLTAEQLQGVTKDETVKGVAARWVLTQDILEALRSLAKRSP